MRIAGITIPEKKHLAFGLTAIRGIGRARAAVVLARADIPLSARPADLTAENENTIREQVDAFPVEGELRRIVEGNIKRLKEIKSYRGGRHTKRLPARGQRTRTNARTLRGARKTMGSGRKKLEKT